jgi:hypothetical protein
MGGDGRAAEGEEDLLVAERVRRAGLAGGDRQAPEADLAGAAGRRGVAGGGDAVLDEGGPAEVLDVTKQAARQTVDHMQAAGLVVREADPADGRRKLLALTASGRRCARSRCRSAPTSRRRSARRAPARCAARCWA